MDIICDSVQIYSPKVASMQHEGIVNLLPLTFVQLPFCDLICLIKEFYFQRTVFFLLKNETQIIFLGKHLHTPDPHDINWSLPNDGAKYCP